MFGREAKRWFTVLVKCASGETLKVSQCAYTKYHAIDLVYTRLCEGQPDRSKYSIKPEGLS